MAASAAPWDGNFSANWVIDEAGESERAFVSMSERELLIVVVTVETLS